MNEDNSKRTNPDPEQGVRHGTLAKGKIKKGHPEKRVVSIVSYRVRLSDVEGLCPKWHVDALRYAGAIKDDTIELLDFRMSQEKVKKKSEERTEIDIS